MLVINIIGELILTKKVNTDCVISDLNISLTLDMQI